MLATGNIRNYQIIVGGLQMMNLPISYICLRFGAIPETVLIVAIAISQCCLAARLYMLRGMIHLKAMDYLKNVYLNVVVVTLLSAIIPVILKIFFESQNIVYFIINVLISLISVAIVEFYIGCSKHERTFILEKAVALRNKIIRR